MIATSDAAANSEASQEAETHRVWCVRSDDAEAATAWTPATGRSEGVTVAVLNGAPLPKLPPAVHVHRVPDDLSYDQLLDLIFESDQVTAC